MQIAKLLELWRETHAPEVSAQLERMADESLRASDPVKPKEWFALAASPGDHMPVLLQIAFDDPTTQVCRRMQVFKGFDEDPRIGVAVGARLRELDGCGGEVSDNKMIAALFDALVKHGDHAFFDLKRAYDLPKLDQQLARLQVAFSGRARRKLTVAELNALSKVDVAAVSGVDGALGRARTANEREVAVDALLEAGGPRAEFILLQTRKARAPLTPKERARETALKKKYASRWMGPVAKVMDDASAEFDGGRLAGGYVGADPDAIAAVLDAAEWGTVKRVEFGYSVSPELLVRWPNITEVEVKHQEHLRELEALKPSLGITHLTLGVRGGQTLKASAFPHLQHLRVDGPMSWVFDAPVLRKLRTLGQLFDHDGSLELRSLVKSLKAAPPKLEKLVFKSRYYGWQVEVSQDLQARIEFIAPEQGAQLGFKSLVELVRAERGGPIKSWSLGRLELPSTSRSSLEALISER